MKKLFQILPMLPIAIFAGGAARADDDMQVQILQNEINGLRQKIVSESDELEKCAKSVKGFQIAGGVTLGLTAVGVGVNIYQAVGRSNTAKEISKVDAQLAEAKAKLETLRITTAAGIPGAGTLTDPQKNMLKEVIGRAKAALQKLDSVVVSGQCSSEDCTKIQRILREAISDQEARLK